MPPAGLARASAAGVTWTSRTAKAGWGYRFSHTSVIDAAGAIYVIGGGGDETLYKDVWVTTDGGARPDTGRGGVGEGTKGVLRGSIGVPRSTRGVN